MQGAAPGAGIVDHDAVGLLGEQRRQGHGHGDDRGADDCRGGERQQARADRLPSVGSRQKAPEPEGDQEIEAEQRDLVAPERDQRGNEPGGGAVGDRATRQRAVEAQKRDGQIGQAQHLADVLDAPGHRRAVGERQRRHEPAHPVPALVAEPQHQRRAAEEHDRHHGGVRRPQAGIGREQGERKKGRGEDHRLRVGDLRMAAEDEGCPEGRLPGGQALRQELDLRLEVRLGVPGDGHPPRQPRPADEKGGQRKEDERRAEAARADRENPFRTSRILAFLGPLHSASLAFMTAGRGHPGGVRGTPNDRHCSSHTLHAL